MPNQYQPFNLSTDIITTKTLLHEAIPITGTIFKFGTGSYIEENIKNFSHGQFQSVYDYPYLSSSANHIFDLAVGYDESSALSSSAAIQNSKKINMYNSMTQILLGYSSTVNEFVERFESDLDVTDNTNQMLEVVFVNFSRLLTKDQIKKGSFSMTVATGSWADAITAGSVVTLTDASASANSGYKSALGGDYGLLYAQDGPLATKLGRAEVGNIFYQAGIAVLTASIFKNDLGGKAEADTLNIDVNGDFSSQFGDLGQTVKGIVQTLSGSSISGACNALRHRVTNIAFNNTTEINSNIFFCRVPWNKFNYSTNPTYVSGAAIVVKNLSSDIPISYVTTIGMYSAAGELMATAKLSEPLRKDPTNELTLRVRLDY
tara:strand:+ start:2104 stop:3228 length:1125 start_codon:yes stop_codon:yes gene_type:complete